MTVEQLPTETLPEKTKAALRDLALHGVVCPECRDPAMLAIDYDKWKRVQCVTCCETVIKGERHGGG